MMILVLVLFLCARGISGTYTPKDHYLLECGGPSNSTAGRIYSSSWSSDENHTFSSSSSSSTMSVSAVLANQIPPFTGARIFNSSFSYTFPVTPGPKFIRLYFSPGVYSAGYDASQFYVTVQANDHVLLRNFSARLAVNYAPFTWWDKHQPESSVIKEYYVTVPKGRTTLNLTFSPISPSSYALVSVPEDLYVSNKSVEYVKSMPNVQFQIPNFAALETAYRLNVGGSDVRDTDEWLMDRLWTYDGPYLFSSSGLEKASRSPNIKYTASVPDYTAPARVYGTERNLGYDAATNEKLNLTWRFKVDPEFTYMVRFHWCEVDFEINTTSDRIFEVYINSQTAEDEADVMLWTNHQRYVPFYKDYVLFVTGGDRSGGSADLWIELHPSIRLVQHTSYNEVLLNGLEIFKISRAEDGSLDTPNPEVSLGDTNSQQPAVGSRKRSHYSSLAIVGGIVVGVVLLFSLLACVCRLKAKKESNMYRTSSNTNKSSWFYPFNMSGVSKTSASEKSSTLPSHLCRRFLLAEIKSATHDFSEGLIIGHGGFRNVYKGTVEGEKGPLEVAIKRLNASSKQGAHEFMTEIELLSKLRHIHLVSLIGFCDEGREMILVYEYMEHGTLRDHLYNTKNAPCHGIRGSPHPWGPQKGSTTCTVVQAK